jgi:hypothetical protein
MSIVIDGPPPGGPSPPEGTFVGANLQKTAEGIDLARHFVEPGNGKLAYPMSSSGTPGGHLVNLTVRTLLNALPWGLRALDLLVSNLSCE